MKHYTLTGLLALCLAVPAAFAADLSAGTSVKAEPATAPFGAVLPKPDLSKPVWVIIQSDKTTPPALTAEQRKTVEALLYGKHFFALSLSSANEQYRFP